MVDHFACRLTAPLPSAIATIAVHGPSVHKLVASILQCQDSDEFWKVNRIRFCKWPISAALSEHVVICRIADNQVEVHCHGGLAVTDAILGSLRRVGCQIVNGQNNLLPQTPEHRMDNLCRQAMLDCRSDRAVGILLDQMHGSQYRALKHIQELLLSKRWSEARNEVTSLMRWFELGDRLCKPWQVILAGPPNVGKSSLINALAGQTISIVHHEAGTTRDWIQTETMMDGWPVALTDTAGIRQTDHHIEREGVLRAEQQIANADLVILVVDSTIGWTSQHDQIMSTIESDHDKTRRKLIAWNKCDLIDSLSSFAITSRLNCPVVACSARQSLDSLISAISKALVPDPPVEGQIVIFDPKLQTLLAEIGVQLATEIDSKAESKLQLLATGLLS